MFKRIGFNDRTLGVEARVGDVVVPASYGKKMIIFNQKCGQTSSTSTSEAFANFECSPSLKGKYLSLQSLEPKQMNIGEVNIFMKGMNEGFF